MKSHAITRKNPDTAESIETRWSGMNTNWIGVAFVSEEVPNREQVEDQLAERTEALRQEAQTALDAWLNEQGLEQVMGVIILKKTI